MERKKKILSKNRRQHWDARGSSGKKNTKKQSRRSSAVLTFVAVNGELSAKVATEKLLCVCVCVARIVSKVSKLISVEEEETQVAQGGVEVVGVALHLNF